MKISSEERKDIKQMILARTEAQGDCLAWTSMRTDGEPVPLPMRHGTHGWIHPREFLYETEFGVVPSKITMSCKNHKCIKVEHMIAVGHNEEAGESQFLPVNSITQNIDTQPRAVIYNSVVEEYADDMLAGAIFPPVDVYFDGRLYWLADGYHRVRAAEFANIGKIRATIHQGDKRDAVLHSFGANAKHGLRRTNEDKRRAVIRLLKDEEWCKWSDRRLAEVAGVHHKTIQNWREELDANPEQREYIDQAGNINVWDMEQTVEKYIEDLENKPEPVDKEPVQGVKAMHADRVRELADYFNESAQTVVYLAVNRLYNSVFIDGELIPAEQLQEVK